MSRSKKYNACRNQLSLLAALLRRRITTQQFRLLVRTLQAADHYQGKLQLDAVQEEFWIDQLSVSIQTIEDSLVGGAVYRADLDMLFHLLRHLFLLPCRSDLAKPDRFLDPVRDAPESQPW